MRGFRRRPYALVLFLGFSFVTLGNAVSLGPEPAVAVVYPPLPVAFVAGGQASSHLGAAVAWAGPTLAVAAPGEDRVYLASLDPLAVPASPGGFGLAFDGWLDVPGLDDDSAMAFDGETLVVGTPRLDGGTASVFTMDAGRWRGPQVLRPGPGDRGNLFGISVAVQDDTLFIGAPGACGWSYAGTAHIYHRVGATWFGLQRLTGPAAQPGAGFGRSLTLVDDAAVIGSPCQDAGASTPAAGRADVFVRPGVTWTADRALLADPPRAGDRFGFSVSAKDGILLIGAPDRDSPVAAALRALGGDTAHEFLSDFLGANGLPPPPYPLPGMASGTVTVYEGGPLAWAQRAELSSDSVGEGLGFAVSTDGEAGVAGAPYGSAVFHSGTARAFGRMGPGWLAEPELFPALTIPKLTAGSPGGGFGFGWAVAMSGGHVAIGNPFDNGLNGAGTGSVYVFPRVGL